MARFVWTPARHAALVAARTLNPGHTDTETAAELRRRRDDMEGVTAKMVRDRWVNHVVFGYQPTTMEMAEWTPLVAELVAAHGRSWATIGPLVRKRVRRPVSNEAIKRIWIRHDKQRARDEDAASYALRVIMEAEPFDVNDLVCLPVPDTPTM